MVVMFSTEHQMMSFHVSMSTKDDILILHVHHQESREDISFKIAQYQSLHFIEVAVNEMKGQAPNILILSQASASLLLSSLPLGHNRHALGHGY